METYSSTRCRMEREFGEVLTKSQRGPVSVSYAVMANLSPWFYPTLRPLAEEMKLRTLRAELIRGQMTAPS